jgi:hypothetical protein
MSMGRRTYLAYNLTTNFVAEVNFRGLDRHKATKIMSLTSPKLGVVSNSTNLHPQDLYIRGPPASDEQHSDNNGR